jgi:putative endonuclease
VVRASAERGETLGATQDATHFRLFFILLCYQYLRSLIQLKILVLFDPQFGERRLKILLSNFNIIMSSQKKYFVYITTNKNHTVLYIGVTNNLSRRIHEHKTKRNRGFTAKYNVDKLVYYEVFDFIEIAIKREKTLKGVTRAKKEALINMKNIEWLELYSTGTITGI